MKTTIKKSLCANGELEETMGKTNELGIKLTGGDLNHTWRGICTLWVSLSSGAKPKDSLAICWLEEHWLDFGIGLVMTGF